MKSLKQIQKECVTKYNYRDWEHFLRTSSITNMDNIFTEVAEMLANEKVTDEFEKLEGKFQDLKEKAETFRDKIYLDGVLAVIETHKNKAE